MKIYAVAHIYDGSYQNTIDMEFVYAETEAEAFLKSDFYADLLDSHTYKDEDGESQQDILPLPVDYPDLLEFLARYYEFRLTIKEGPLV